MLSVFHHVAYSLTALLAIGSTKGHCRPAASERMPYEVLLYIFRWLPPLIPDDYVKKDKRVPARIAFTFVCRTWRIVALNEKSAWSYIPMTPLLWMKICLERSSPQFIKIDLPSNFLLHGKSDAGPAFRLCDHITRIEDLNIHIPRRYITEGKNRVEKALLCLIPFPSTHPLRILSLGFGDRFQCWSSYSGMVHIPQTIFSNAAPPEFTSLTLNNCAITVSSPLLSNALTVLNLHTCIVWDTLADMVESLGKLSKLQVLCVSIRDMDVRILPAQPVALPYLESLELGNSLNTSATILAYIKPKSDIQIRIAPPAKSSLRGRVLAWTAVNLTRALQIHLSSYGRGSNVLIDISNSGICVEGRWSSTDASIVADPQDVRDCKRVENSQAFEQRLLTPPDFSITFPDTLKGGRIVMREMFSIAAFQHCTALAIRGDALKDAHICLSLIWSVLYQFRDVDTLELASVAAQSFFVALDFPASSGNVPPFAPRVLHLSAIDLDSKQIGGSPINDMLRRWLSGLPPGHFKHLSIRKCKVSWTTIASLREHLREASMHWDGFKDYRDVEPLSQPRF